MFTQSCDFTVSVILHDVQDDRDLWVNCYIISKTKKSIAKNRINSSAIRRSRFLSFYNGSREM